MPIALGVDLGSTHCKIGVWHQNRPEVIANHHGLRATPTMVAFSDTEVLAGEAALSQMPKNVTNTITGFKSMVGQKHAQLEAHIKAMLESAPFRCSVDSKGEARVAVMHKGEERSVAAETLCGHLFEHLKDIAEAFAGEAVGRCVLSVPASFTRGQREALRDIGKRAGLPFSLVISDPVAAAIAYGLDRPDAEMDGTCGREGRVSKPKSTIVVVDWGGGGVEATVLRRTDGMLSVAGQAADPSVGGGVFTERLVKFCAKDFKRRTGSDVFESRRSVLKSGGENKPKSTIVVVDWGGGGVEATVLRRTDGMLSVAGQAADPSVGGGVFTERLVKFCAKDFKRRTGSDVFESRRSVLKVTRGCEEAVRTLSASSQANVYIEAAHEGCDMNVKISRTRFEDLCFDLYKSATEVISKALAQAGAAPETADMVLLAGGIVQMPRVASAVKANFPAGTPFGAGLAPDEVVAVGATIQAFLLQEHASFVAPGAPPLPQLIRACPVSIGVRWSGGVNENGDGGIETMIAQGSILPAQNTVTVKLLKKSEKALVVEVVEVGPALDGEDPPRVRLLGMLGFEGIDDQGEEGVVEVTVGCTLRTEGVLKVEAVETSGGVKKELVIGHEKDS